MVLAAEKLDSSGMVCDFRVVKRYLATITDRLDHKYLNELELFAEDNPTTEHVARFVCEELDRLLTENVSEGVPEGVRVARVTAWESEGCGATYINERGP